ncbi:MAG: dihydroorotate dehydrogenase (quinone) [Betaproteobacteria bacterium]|nr:MAG: dihydroorotate dehydrogenase (quinone) [Betaproteobacteria bacterium]
MRPRLPPLPNPVMLAAGHDRDGTRAAKLLSAGFGAVEFGSVCPAPVPGRHDGAAALAARLLSLRREAVFDCAIGINLGAQPGATPRNLVRDWLAGWDACWPAADYLAFNLSAEAIQPLLAPQQAPLLRRAFLALALARDELVLARGRQVAVAVKLSLGAEGPLPPAVELAAEAGLDAVIAVLPAGAIRFQRLHEAAACAGGCSALIAVGGLRDAADVALARAAGATAVQVYSAYAEQGAGCLKALLSPENR